MSKVEYLNEDNLLPVMKKAFNDKQASGVGSSDLLCGEDKAGEFKQRVIDIITSKSEVYREVDGYMVYWPKGCGFMTAPMLRVIADYLDENNKEWSDKIDNEFKA